MKPDHLLTRSCTVVHREYGGEDEYGNPTLDETVSARRCYLEQRRSEEPAGVGERAHTDWFVVLPVETPVTVADAIRVDTGLQLEVTSDPWTVHNPVGGYFTHIELLARETEA